jgi:protein arginine N-methyltransferase 2
MGDSQQDTPNARLLAAAERGDVEEVERLVAGDPSEANPDCARAEDGASPLMLAAENGHAAVVAALLRAGASWNLLDDGGHCAGEYSGGQHPEITQMLMQWGVEMEELLAEREEQEEKSGGASAPGRRRRDEEEESRAYLSQELVYDDSHPTGPRLLDANGDAVMMGWETEIMRRHADQLCGGGGGGAAEGGSSSSTSGMAVLNIGFGLGIVDRELQRYKPARHVIVEAHPDVLARIDAEGWPSRPGVTVLRGRWEDVLLLPPGGAGGGGEAEGGDQPSSAAAEIADILSSGGFDAIYWDTYAQHARQLAAFHALLPRLLKKPGGRYAWWNGVGSDNALFHSVSTQVIARQLARLGFSTRFERFSVGDLGDETWQGVARSYWSLPFYLMPLVRWEEEEKEEKADEGDGGERQREQ